MKVFRTAFLMILLCPFLCGCQNNKEHPGSLNLTQEVHVDCQYRQNTIKRTYTNSDKIDVILKYLHALPSPGQPYRHPVPQSGDLCKITVLLWDGRQHHYELNNKNLLRINSGEWFDIEPEKANVIYHLVNHIESDKNAH